MIIMICLDDRGGMLFNKRRQSQDVLLRQQILTETAGGRLWMNSYSAKAVRRGKRGKYSRRRGFYGQSPAR